MTSVLLRNNGYHAHYAVNTASCLGSRPTED